MEAVCPQMRGRIVEISDDVRLHKATGENLTSRIRTLARKVKARAQREKADVACVFIHEDFDRPDGAAWTAAHAKVEQELSKSLGTGHYVLAAAEMEAWLLLFPGALADTVTTWQIPERRVGRDTGRMADPKRILMTEVTGKGGRKYRESDAPEVVRNIVDNGHLSAPQGTNRSLDRFNEDARVCGEKHIGSGKG
nr:hypothetical protein [Nocardiopsis mwathae]